MIQMMVRLERVIERCVTNSGVRILQRIGRRGLSSAVVEGILSTTAPYVAVIDADLQHDEPLSRQMLTSFAGASSI